MTTRSDIVAEAKTYLGTPWKHMGRKKRKGVDCVGLIIAIARDLELVNARSLDAIPPYRRDPDGTLLSYFEKHMDPADPNHLKAGQVLIFSFFDLPWHAGIVTDPVQRYMIHAFAPARKVCVDSVDNRWKGRTIAAAWDWRCFNG